MQRGGFTMLELIVCTAIVALLFVILLPGVQWSREAARRTRCKNNLKQIGLALRNYEGHHGVLPPGYILQTPAGEPTVGAGRNGAGWGTFLLPMLERGGLYDTFDPHAGVEDPKHKGFRETSVAAFECPSDPGPWLVEAVAADDPSRVLARLARANYAGVAGTAPLPGTARQAADPRPPGPPDNRVLGPLRDNDSVRLDEVRDGLGNTFLVGERKTDPAAGQLTVWAGVVPGGLDAAARVLGTTDRIPNGGLPRPEDFSSRHPGGIQLVLCDGRVIFWSSRGDPGDYRRMSTIAGGEIPEYEFW